MTAKRRATGRHHYIQRVQKSILGPEHLHERWWGVQVRGQLGALQAACAALKGSADLMTVLRAVLLTGNHLNKGTHRGAADGAPNSRRQLAGSVLGGFLGF